MIVTDIEVSGLNIETSEAIISALFSNNENKSTIKLYIDEKIKKQKVTMPFVDEYEIKFKSYNSIKITVYEKSVMAYLKCMGKNWFFDKDGIVIENYGGNDTDVNNIPEVTGLRFEYIVTGEKIPLENKKIFDILLELTQLIIKYELNISRINIDSDNQFIIYMGKVRIELGTGDMLNEKILDLHDMKDEIEDVDGVLNMREYDKNRKGYTFKKDAS